MATSEQLRRVRGGVGTLETKFVTDYEAVASVGSVPLGIKVPAGRAVVGAVIKNTANDLAGAEGAKVALNAGEVALVAATTITSTKGGVAGGMLASAKAFKEDTELSLVVSVGALTGGKLDIGILYV